MHESHIIETLDEPIRYAVLELFHGDRKAAAIWLSTPCKALGNISPIDSISESGDEKNVINVIGRLAHGVFQ